MKKDNFIAFSFLLILVIMSDKLKAQIDNHPWCPNGATWVYLRTTQFSREYLKLSYARDTIIANKATKILALSQIEIVGPGPFPNYSRSEQYLRDEYYCNVNDSIFWWNNNQFVFLYDFNPNTGAEWFINTNQEYTCNSSFNFIPDTFTVMNIGVQAFDGKNFNTINGSNKGRWNIGQTVIKNIGSLTSPYPIPIHPNPSAGTHPCNHKDFYGSPNQLVCYNDDLRGNIAFSPTLTGNCAYELTSTRQLKARNKEGISIRLFPNPSSRSISVDILNPKIDINSFEIFNINGKRIQIKTFSSNHDINISELETGVYILLLHGKNESYPLKFIKI